MGFPLLSNMALGKILVTNRQDKVVFSEVSRFLASFLDPFTFLICLLLASSFLAIARRRRGATIVLVLALVVIGLAGWKPFPKFIIRPLEERFPIWKDSGDDVAGIVVLGGGLNAELFRWRPGSGLSGASGRLTETVFLSRRFPAAKILYSGGGESMSEAEQGREFIGRLGIEPERIILETRSRTTAQNAQFSCETITPKPGQTWLLVTSAAHMPRAVGAFRAVGFEAKPYPVEHRSMPSSSSLSFDLAGGLEVLRAALKEYVGLVAYRLAGKTMELFPGSPMDIRAIGRCDGTS